MESDERPGVTSVAADIHFFAGGTFRGFVSLVREAVDDWDNRMGNVVLSFALCMSGTFGVFQKGPERHETLVPCGEVPLSALIGVFLPWLILALLLPFL